MSCSITNQEPSVNNPSLVLGGITAETPSSQNGQGPAHAPAHTTALQGQNDAALDNVQPVPPIATTAPPAAIPQSPVLQPLAPAPGPAPVIVMVAPAANNSLMQSLYGHASIAFEDEAEGQDENDDDDDDAGA
ncbi:hypothetical protein FRC07_007450 [Ceratobasidium sp. 392]|nr:hypothetical protein FRC07_007450 [Ceratobasidium sp. 392]